MEHVEIWNKDNAYVRLQRVRLNPGNYEVNITAAKANNESKAAAKQINVLAQTLRSLGVSERQLIICIGQILQQARGWFLVSEN